MFRSETAYLSLGSNLGNRADYLKRATEALSKLGKIIDISKIYETLPWGVRDEQPMYLNSACKLLTELNPHELAQSIKQIERALGRKAGSTNQPRTIDIDILLYGDLTLESNELTIPHPEMNGRAFVLLPMNDIASNLVDPKTKLTISQLLDRIDTSFGVSVYEG